MFLLFSVLSCCCGGGGGGGLNGGGVCFVSVVSLVLWSFFAEVGGYTALHGDDYGSDGFAMCVVWGCPVAM